MRCGPRLLAHISKKRFGIGLEDEQADAYCLLDSDGTSPEGMEHGFRSLGFKRVEIIEGMSLDDLEALRRNGATVALCYLSGGGPDDGHWVELLSVDSDLVGVWDSDTGQRAIPRRHFEVLWYDYTVKDGKWILRDRCAVIGFDARP